MKISLITAAYNSAATIGDTLASVNRQTHPDVEHIVIDGGSTDDTVAIVKARGERVARLVSERDRGIYDAMNKGIAIATGDVVGFVNSDDVLADRHVLSRYAEAFIMEPAVDALHGDLVYTESACLDRVVRYWRGREFVEGAFAYGWMPAHPTFYVRSRIYRDFGGFDLSFQPGADVELMCRLLHRYRVRSRHLNKIMVRMRAGGESNASWATIWKQNQVIALALKTHGTACGPRFLAWKLMDRIVQRLSARRGQRLLTPWA